MNFLKKFFIIVFIIFFVNLSSFASDDKIHVAYCIDHNYPIYTMLSMNSLLINKNADSKVFFHVVEENLSKFQKLQMKLFIQSKGAEIEFIHYDTFEFDKGKNFFAYTHCKHITRIGNARLVLPRLLPFIDKILYIDADTLVATDISQLWNIDLGNNYAGMITDISQYIKNNKPPQKYYNSGVILMNAKLWRENNISEKLIEYLLTQTYKYPDQDALNNVLTGKIKRLDFIWNFQSTDFLKFDNSPLKLPNGIFHYVGGAKPWHFLFSKDPATKEYLKYWNKSYLIIYKVYQLCLNIIYS